MKIKKNFLFYLMILFAISFSQIEAKEKKVYSSIEEQEESVEPFQGDYHFFNHDVSLSFGANYFDSFGLRTRFAKQILGNRKFIANFTNALYFEGGFGTTFYGDVGKSSGVTGFDLLATVRFDAQHSQKLTLFSNLGLRRWILSCPRFWLFLSL